MNEKKWKNKCFFDALINSVNGINYALKNERNLKIQLIIAIFVIGISIFLKLSVTNLSILILCIGLVLTAEFINTVVENVLDLYTQEYNENVKNIKDVASGMVLFSSIISAIIGTLILGRALIEYFI